MLDTVKPTAPVIQIITGLFRCNSIDPEGTAQARTFYYKIVHIAKFSTKVLAQYLCTEFGNVYNFEIERSSEYTAGVPQSTKEGELYVYKLFYSPAYTYVLLKYFQFTFTPTIIM